MADRIIKNLPANNWGGKIIGKFIFLRHIAKVHPNLFSAVWFAFAALILTSPLVTIAFLLPIITPTHPASASVLFLLQGVLLPVIIASPSGAIIGGRILSLPSGNTLRAALYGLLTGLATFIIWGALLEVIPSLSGFTPSGNSGGDLPGAAIVLAYLVVLPGVVFSVMIMGALAGILMHKSFSDR